MDDLWALIEDEVVAAKYDEVAPSVVVTNIRRWIAEVLDAQETALGSRPEQQPYAESWASQMAMLYTIRLALLGKEETE